MESARKKIRIIHDDDDDDNFRFVTMDGDSISPELLFNKYRHELVMIIERESHIVQLLGFLERSSRAGLNFVQTYNLWQRAFKSKYPTLYEKYYSQYEPGQMKEEIRDIIDDNSIQPERKHTYWKRFIEIIERKFHVGSLQYKKIDKIQFRDEFLELMIEDAYSLHVYRHKDIAKEEIFIKLLKFPLDYKDPAKMMHINLTLMSAQKVKYSNDNFGPNIGRNDFQPQIRTWKSKTNLYKYIYNTRNDTITRYVLAPTHGPNLVSEPIELQDCNFCGEPATLHCGDCKIARYCSIDCQEEDWNHNEDSHRHWCFDRENPDEDHLEMLVDACLDRQRINPENYYQDESDISFDDIEDMVDYLNAELEYQYDLNLDPYLVGAPSLKEFKYGAQEFVHKRKKKKGRRKKMTGKFKQATSLGITKKGKERKKGR